MTRLASPIQPQRRNPFAAYTTAPPRGNPFERFATPQSEPDDTADLPSLPGKARGIARPPSFVSQFVDALPDVTMDLVAAPASSSARQRLAPDVRTAGRVVAAVPGVAAAVGSEVAGVASEIPGVARDIAVAPFSSSARGRLADDVAPFHDPQAAQQFQQNLAKSASGQTALRVEQALSRVAEAGLSQASLAFGSGKMSATLHRQKAERERFLTEAEKGGKIEQWLGATGSKIYNSVVGSVAEMGVAGMAGPAGIYSLIIGENWDDALAEAKANNMAGLDAVSYAANKTTIDAGVTFLFGRAGKRLGFDSLEEVLSPGIRNAAQRLAASAVPKSTLAKLAKSTGGASLESLEELAIDAAQQGVELEAGTAKAFDWERALTAAATGGVARLAVGAAKEVAAALRKIPAAKIDETVKGVKAAEELVQAATPDVDQVAVEPASAAANTTPNAEPAASQPAGQTVRQSLAAAESAAAEPGLSGRGARGARRFFEAATPDLLEAARRPMNAKEFAAVTGIKKTSAVFRGAFRDTLDLYARLPRPTDSVQAFRTPTAAPDATEAAGTTTEPSEAPTPPTGSTRAATSVARASEDSANPAVTAYATAESVADPATPGAGMVAEVAPVDASAPETPRQRRTRSQIRIESLTRQLGQARDSIGRLRERYRTTSVLRESDLNEAMAIARENLGPEGAGRILGAIRDARTPAGFQRFLKTVNDGLDRRERADATADFHRAVKESANIGRPEYREKARAVLADIDAGPQRGRFSRERLQQVRDYLAANPEHPMPPRLLAALDRLDKTPHTELTVEELRQATAALDSLAHFDRMKNEFLDARQQRSIDEAAKVIVEQIGTVAEPAGPLGESLAIGKAAAQALGRAAFRPENVLDSLSPDAKHLIWERLQVEGANHERTLREKLRRPVDALLQQLGLPVDRGLVGQLTGLTERSSLVDSPLNRWRDEKRKVGGVDMTRGEATGVYLSLRDPQNAAVARRHGFILRPKAFGLRKRQLPINDTTLEQMAEFIGDEGRQIADTIFQQINSTARDAVNESYLAVHGHLLSERNDYVPRKIDHDAVQEIKGVEEFLSSSGYKSLAGSGILQARTGGGPIEVDDALDAYNRHIDTVSRIAAYLEPVRDIHAVLKRRGVREAIDAKAGPGATDSILDRINLQAVHSFDRTTAERGARALLRGIVPAKIALKLGPVLLQSVGLLPSAAYRKNGASRLWDSVAVLGNRRERLRILRAMNEHSAMARERYGGAWVREASGGLMAVRGAWRPNTLMDLATKPLEEAERQIGAVLRWKQAEGYVAGELGLAPDDPMYHREVAREWERMMYRGENSSSGLEMNGAIAAGRRNAFVAPFVAFTSSASKSGSLLAHGKNQFAAGDARGGAQTYAMYGAGVIAAALIRKLIGRLRGKDPEDEETIVQQAVGEIVGHFPGGNEVLQPIARHVMGLNAQSDRPNVLMGQIATGVEGLRALYDAIHGEFFGELELTDDGEPASREKFRQAADKLATAVAPLARIPYDGLKDWTNIAANAFGGGPGNEDVANRLRAQLRESLGETDTSDARKAVLHAIRTGDDELFVKTIRAVQAADPAKVTPQWLRGIVEGRFANLRYVEGKLARGEVDFQSLDDAQIEALNDLGAERQEMLEAMYELVERNL